MFTEQGIRDFDLDHIFQCGQCFRWEKQKDGSYNGIARGKIVNVRYDSAAGNKDISAGPDIVADAAGALTVTPCTPEEFDNIWRPYFDLDRDYGAIKKTLSDNDEVMKRASDYGYGIRLLKQDLWETIVSFIISQNNNIPRIKGCISRLCENFGEPIREEPEFATLMADDSDASGNELHQRDADSRSTAYDIPSPEKLASLTVDDLGSVRLGYRAKYLIETARTVCEKGLPGNFDELSELCGVGPKVANCISLFGMQNYDSFPIDVWVMKVMHELYGLPEKDKKEMARFAREKFGDLGGFAQQYLFYYMRDRS